jgi:hypothetical protein
VRALLSLRRRLLDVITFVFAAAGVVCACNRTSARGVAIVADAGQVDDSDAGSQPRRRWVVVSGKVSGLTSPIELGLSSPSAEPIDTARIASNGSFEFTEPVKVGETYAVSVKTQPEEGFCVVSNASGVARADVDDVEVICSPDNPGLAAIEATIGRLSPAFDPNLTRYRLDVFAWVSSVGVTPTLADNRARAYLDGREYRGEPLAVDVEPGQTAVSIDVDLEDGERRRFTLDIYRPTRVVEESYAKAKQPTEGAQYAYALSLNSAPDWAGGAVLAVGAPGHPSKTQTINGSQTDLGASLSGAVLLYSRDDAGQWREEAFIKASNAEAEDLFGISVALEGDLLVVGAPEEDGESGGVNGDDGNETPGSGAVYVFRYHDAAWRQEAYLKAEFPTVGDGFGRSVALENGESGAVRIAVGAWHDSNSAVGTNPKQRDSAAANSGAAYVFEYRAGGWVQVSYLKPSNTDFADSFGETIALDGDTLVVGAPLEAGAVGKINGDQANNDAFAAGAAYVFAYDLDNDAWYQRSYLKPSTVAADQRFGNAVDVQGDTIVVGAFTEQNSATGVNPPVAEEVAEESGAVFVFTRKGDEWSQQAYLKSSNTDVRDRFGHAVALHGDTLVVGAPLESSGAQMTAADQSNNDAAGAGAVYVFSRSDGTWSLEEYLKASNPEPGDNFGAAVAFEGKHLVVGAPYEDSNVGGTTSESGPNNAAIAAGAFYVFR